MKNPVCEFCGESFVENLDGIDNICDDCHNDMIEEDLDDLDWAMASGGLLGD